MMSPVSILIKLVIAWLSLYLIFLTNRQLRCNPRALFALVALLFSFGFSLFVYGFIVGSRWANSSMV